MGLAFPKPEPRARDKKERSREKLRHLQSVRAAVKIRDGGRCRVCRTREGVEVHHIQFRSRGGADVPSNLALLCTSCHSDVHAYRLVVSGDANGKLRIERTR